ncbi:CRP-like cAMP-binding protein [Candidatus Methylobacter favarea]|uniref:CRP-like cAMP-binding protein n=1 Tax=Candidatus Methylobacter favarea TaxID=2707345 RepID=A0A8S0X2L7_9GAMM|nr:Crp/Fnr family transcriptional regulator [Candidatus Methylobacter favarea]CAA9892024.1 CRP-like cAMP-binding protein [Candidatus Methylobacter favarea]
MQKHCIKIHLSSVFTEDKLEKWRKNYPSLQKINIPDKGFLYRQGHSCSHVFWINTGIIKLSHITEQGNELIVALLQSGDITGSLPAAGASSLMEETAQAVGEATLFRLEYHDFKALISHQPDLSWQVFATQSIRRQQAERKLLNILAQPVESRIIAMLKELAEMFGIRCAHGYALEIHLTQQELADLVGASRPAVSTIMNDLRSRGILEYTRELICVNDILFSTSGKQE